MKAAAEAEQFEAAARLRDQLSTVHQTAGKAAHRHRRQTTTPTSSATTLKTDALAVNLFHMRGGKIVDRREFFWEDLPEFLETPHAESEKRTASEAVILSDRSVAEEVEGPAVALLKAGRESASDSETSGAPSLTILGAPSLSQSRVGKQESTFNAGQVFSALLKQLYIDQHYVPRSILVPVDFDDRETLADAAHRTHRPPHRNRRPAARRKALPRRPRRPERQAVLHPALPRPRAIAQSHSGSPRRRPHAPRTPPPHRVLRHLPHPGR